MDSLLAVWAALGACSLLSWVWLVSARGAFWRTDRHLAQGRANDEADEWPAVCAVVPARNEAAMLPETLPALLGQEYPGPFHVLLVDDHSEDGTGEAARELADSAGLTSRLTVVQAEPLAPGWSGKLWALENGLQSARRRACEFLLLTDADIRHPSSSVRDLVARARSEQADLVSLMALLRAETFWERLLIPAFVYFFAMIYPFRWVANPRRRTAAAAGGCILVSRSALERSGGLEPIAGELIDDCSLAAQVKRHGGKLWLGLTREVRSARGYEGLGPIWSMVARTAFVQLRYSWLLLLGTVAGMALVFLVPPLSTLAGLAWIFLRPEAGGGWWPAALGLVAWGLMTWSYMPMLKWYRMPSVLAPALPITAALYALMTADSALRFQRGLGGRWKGRAYSRAQLASRPADSEGQPG